MAHLGGVLQSDQRLPIPVTIVVDDQVARDAIEPRTEGHAAPPKAGQMGHHPRDTSPVKSLASG